MSSKEIKIHTWFEFYKLMENLSKDENIRWHDGQKPTDYQPYYKPEIVNIETSTKRLTWG